MYVYKVAKQYFAKILFVRNIGLFSFVPAIQIQGLDQEFIERCKAKAKEQGYITNEGEGKITKWVRHLIEKELGTESPTDFRGLTFTRAHLFKALSKGKKLDALNRLSYHILKEKDIQGLDHKSKRFSPASQGQVDFLISELRKWLSSCRVPYEFGLNEKRVVVSENEIEDYGRFLALGIEIKKAQTANT